MPSGNARGKKSERKAKDEIHGQYRYAAWMWKISSVLRLAEDGSVWLTIAANVNLDTAHR